MIMKSADSSEQCRVAAGYGLARVPIRIAPGVYLPITIHYYILLRVVSRVPGHGGVRISVTDQFGHRDRLIRASNLGPGHILWVRPCHL